MRVLVAIALTLTLLVGPAFADARDDALAACAAYMKKNGSPMSNIRVSGSGERFIVEGTGTHQGRENVRVICKTNKGRVTNVTWG